MYKYLLLILSGLIASCSNGTKPLPASKGQTLEVLFICNDTLWESSIHIRKTLNASTYLTPTAEPLFKLIRINPIKFKNHFKKFRNIILLEQGKHDTVLMQHNVWATPQVVCTIQYKNGNIPAALLDTCKHHIILLEQKRLHETYKKHNQPLITQKIKNTFNIDCYIPEGYTIAIEKPNFLWLRQETELTSQNIVFATAPLQTYANTTIKTYRDSLAQLYILGVLPNSYMITDTLQPIHHITTSNLYTVTGRWKMHNDFMGGPFITQIKHNNIKNNPVFIDCFVYAPSRKNITLLFQTEHLLINQ